MMEVLKKYQRLPNLYIITNSIKPTEPRTMQNRFKAVLKACQLRDVNFHLLRHTYATVCIEKGFDPKALSELLGHADASITLNRYVRKIDVYRCDCNIWAELTKSTCAFQAIILYHKSIYLSKIFTKKVAFLKIL